MSNQQIRELANAIAQQADAVATGNHTADAHAVALLMQDNVKTLVAWTERERSRANETSPVRARTMTSFVYGS